MKQMWSQLGCVIFSLLEAPRLDIQGSKRLIERLSASSQLCYRIYYLYKEEAPAPTLEGAFFLGPPIPGLSLREF